MKQLIRKPNNTETSKIQKIFPNVSQSNHSIIRINAFHNLRTRGDYAWHENDVNALADTYIGKPAIFDHSWGKYKGIVGGVFDARVIELTKEEMADYDPTYNNNTNEFIAQNGAVKMLQLDVFVEDNNDLFKLIQSGYTYKNSVSIGANGKETALCPLSQLPFTFQWNQWEDNDFGKSKCGHELCKQCIIAIWGMIDDIDLSRIPDSQPIYDFYIRSGLYEAVEISIVIAPMLPGVGLIQF